MNRNRKSHLRDSYELQNMPSDMRLSQHSNLDARSHGQSNIRPSWNESTTRRRFNLETVRQILSSIWTGPAVAEDLPPAPILSLWKLEQIPYKVGRIPLKFRRWGLGLYLVFWCFICYTIIMPYLTIPPYSPDRPGEKVISLSCGEEPSFWRGKNGKCGFNGDLCPTLLEKDDVIFRCPALCDRGSFTFSWIPVGDERIKYRGYFVGGGVLDKPGPNGELTHPYRADSFPCGAAIHSGLISPFFGGCVRASWTGSKGSFSSTKGHYGVSDSVGFMSFFPKSYIFKKLTDSYNNCKDPRLTILAINIALGAPVVFLSSGLTAYWVVTISGFWTIMFATDPPFVVDPANDEDFASLLSLALERLLPVCFILYVLWVCSVKRTLGEYPINLAKFGGNTDDEYIQVSQSPEEDEEEVERYDLEESMELQRNYQSQDRQGSLHYGSRIYRLLLFYPFFWLGILNNITFDRLPVDRLTIADITTQAGAAVAVLSIISLILTGVVIQAYKIWLSGRFRKYFTIYIGLIISLVIISMLPGLVLRIHHYILALLLIPGCATRGKTALIFQGVLLGLFLSGAVRWGLASIAETATHLLRNDPKGKLLPPSFKSFESLTGLLSWNGTLNKDYNEFDGVSILINDVEGWVGPVNATSVNLVEILQNNFFTSMIEKTLKDDNVKDANGNISIFIRIGRKILGSSKYGDFSYAAKLKWPIKEFIYPIEEGVT